MNWNNIGKRDILIFLKFENIDLIQDIRNKFDPLANIIAPHITLAFPFLDNMSNEELIIKLYIITSPAGVGKNTISKLPQITENIYKFRSNYILISINN